MAANTAITATLTAKDWEILIGLLGNTNDTITAELRFALQTYYKANSNPNGNTAVPIVTTEETVVYVYTLIHQWALMSSHKEAGASPYKRITDAIRLMNNIADNFIQTQLDAFLALIETVHTDNRKLGRKIIMMKAFDNA